VRLDSVAGRCVKLTLLTGSVRPSRDGGVDRDDWLVRERLDEPGGAMAGVADHAPDAKHRQQERQDIHGLFYSRKNPIPQAEIGHLE